MARLHELEDEKRRILLACLPIIDNLATAELVNPDSEALDAAIRTLRGVVMSVRKRIKIQLKLASSDVKRALEFQDKLLSIASSTLISQPVNTELLKKQILLVIKSSSDILVPAKTL